MLTGYQENKERLSKKACQRYQIFLKKKKPKSANMLFSDIEIFLKNEKKKRVNMVVNNIKNL